MTNGDMVGSEAADDGGKKKLVYFLLGWLLGFVGAHKWYVGDKKNAIIYLIIGICTCAVGGIILGLISGIMALTMKSEEEFRQKYVIDKKFL